LATGASTCWLAVAEAAIDPRLLLKNGGSSAPRHEEDR